MLKPSGHELPNFWASWTERPGKQTRVGTACSRRLCTLLRDKIRMLMRSAQEILSMMDSKRLSIRDMAVPEATLCSPGSLPGGSFKISWPPDAMSTMVQYVLGRKYQCVDSVAMAFVCLRTFEVKEMFWTCREFWVKTQELGSPPDQLT